MLEPALGASLNLACRHLCKEDPWTEQIQEPLLSWNTVEF